MRILFVTATYPPTVNGVSYQIQILKKELEKLGHLVYVLAPSFPGFKDSEKRIIRYPSIPNPIAKKYPLGLPVISPIKLKEINPDIIHTHHPLIIGQIASFLAEYLKKPLIFTAHTQYEKYFHEYLPYSQRITSKIINKNLLSLAKKCAFVICPSTHTQRKYLKLGIKNALVIYNAIEKNFFHFPQPKKLEKPTLVFVGRLEREKNPLFLIDIAQKLKKILPDFNLLIIGDGNLFYPIVEKARAAKLDKNIFLTGELERNSLPQIYRSAHLFLTPSETEVMPLSIIEAMACGIPVIALKKSGLEDVVLNEKTGFMLPKNSTLIATKIQEIFSNLKLLNQLSQNAYRHAFNFSIEKEAQKIQKIYQEAISDNSRKSKFPGRRGKSFGW